MWISGCFVLLCLVTTTLAQDNEEDGGVIFPSGEVFYPVDPSDLDQSTLAQLHDPKNTGSHIYEYDEANTQKKFTLNLYERNFKSSSSNYYRAHPVFTSCLQKVYSYVLTRAGKTIKIASGYQTLSDVGGGSRQAEYARSGCGATLAFQDGQTGEPLLDIAKGVIHHCLNLFGEELRDLGVIMLSDGVHVHMTGPGDVTTHFDVDGYTHMTQPEFETWAWGTLDEAIDPIKPPECVNLPEMGDGESYPEGVSDPGTVVGRLDKPVTRDNHEDFKHLRQWAGSNMDFEGCDDYLEGNAPESRCSNRLFSPRLYNGLRLLQKMIRKHIPGNGLDVQKAWTEEDLAVDETTLHQEGRAAQLRLKQDNTPANLATLAQQALCSGLDYIKNNGDHVLVAVRKQAGMRPLVTSFDETQVLHVLPPSEDRLQYELVTEESAEFPLLDSADQDDVLLGEYARLGQFKSPTLRYMRLDPLISRCYDSIMRTESKWNDGVSVPITVVSSFLGAEELEEIGPELDHRGYSPTLGQSLTMAYDASLAAEDYNIHRLARIAIQECAPIFFRNHKQMGVGFYEEGLFVDLRDEFEVWQGGSSPQSPGMLMDSYILLLEDRYYSAVEGRTINPTNPKEAEGREVIPEPQSPEYEYQAPSNVYSSNLQAHTTPSAATEPACNETMSNSNSSETCSVAAVEVATSQAAAQYSSDEDCVPQDNTEFCSYSKPHRDAMVEHIWKQFKRKHMTRDEGDIRGALEGCFGACGTCVKGWIYEEKTKQCDNLLHWMPFRVLNAKPDVSTMYQKENFHMHDLACRGDNMCIYNAPLFAILGMPLNKLFRRYPDKSIEEELYGANDNPLPVYELVLKIHAIEAQEQLTVYVRDDTEIKDLRSPLKVGMVYNKDVTFVQVYVDEDEQVPLVERSMQNMVSDWVANTHPGHTREAVVPFSVDPMPSGIQKRSLEDDFHTQLMIERRDYERHWYQKVFH